jgi:glycosyltransferase involved in cell wall biosynthesis
MKKKKRKQPIRLRDIHKMQRWKKHGIEVTWDNITKSGICFDGNMHLGPYEGIRNAWAGEPCFVVGGSKALEGFDLNKINGYHSIGINHIIEDYSKFEWFMFLDQRFLNKTTFDMSSYKGKIFASNKTVCFGDNVVRFHTMGQRDKPTMNIEKGLYNGFLTGLCAIHLALISGANPIYLLGFGNTYDSIGDNHHYKKDYTGETKTPQKVKKYSGAANYAKAFLPWKQKIIHVTPGSHDYSFFKQIKPNEIPFAKLKKRKSKVKVKKARQPVICHVGTMPNIDTMGDISRYVFNKSMGKHLYSNINAQIHPKADIYLLEVFINGHDKYRNFQKPKGSKVVSLIHSSSTCLPAINSDRVVVLTKAWQKVMLDKGFRSTVIPAGINLATYKELPDYEKPTFGRITRYSPGKVHQATNGIVTNILNSVEDSQYYMISSTKNQIKHERAHYITDIKISQLENKARALQKFGVFLDIHNTFIETFSLCLLEAMAAGQAILMYNYKQHKQVSMLEIIGKDGIIIDDINKIKDTVITLLQNVEMKKEYGFRARNRAKEYSIQKMIAGYNKLFKELL